jgi:hypothetical protein
MGGTPSSAVFSVAVVLFGLADGLIVMYMWTRIRFLEVIKENSAD